MELEFESLNKTTLAEQVMEQLASKIIAGDLTAGQRLPPERELAELLQVSRSRVREALRALSLVGLVTIRPGGGTYVCDRIDQMPKNSIMWLFRQQAPKYSELYEARRMIEPAIYTSCFRNKTDEIVAGICEHVDRITRANEGDISGEQFNQLLEDEDIYVAMNCGNSVFYKIMQTIILLRHEDCVHICDSPINRNTSVAKRNSIADAFKRDDSKTLKKVLDEFFDVQLQI